MTSVSKITIVLNPRGSESIGPNQQDTHKNDAFGDYASFYLPTFHLSQFSSSVSCWANLSQNEVLEQWA